MLGGIGSSAGGCGGSRSQTRAPHLGDGERQRTVAAEDEVALHERECLLRCALSVALEWPRHAPLAMCSNLVCRQRASRRGQRDTRSAASPQVCKKPSDALDDPLCRSKSAGRAVDDGPSAQAAMHSEGVHQLGVRRRADDILARSVARCEANGIARCFGRAAGSALARRRTHPDEELRRPEVRMRRHGRRASRRSAALARLVDRRAAWRLVERSCASALEPDSCAQRWIAPRRRSRGQERCRWRTGGRTRAASADKVGSDTRALDCHAWPPLRGAKWLSRAHAVEMHTTGMRAVWANGRHCSPRRTALEVPLPIPWASDVSDDRLPCEWEPLTGQCGVKSV